ncbi:MAG: phosphoribosylanthranilate isomerase [Saprospiraceae bacterium]|jgi:phosphoribosylanthranilate isomerase|nr:phosphoribosylanthranilate isomerase [Saprospiraceae bacterium]MBL0026136.1 phosphoribosylanthranilate isomerase [Saprospiraceae bacterium]
MIIKVCGLKSAKNLLEVSLLGINMVGYNFYVKSPRYVDIDMPEIKGEIQKVGVFVNDTIEKIREKKERYGLNFIQLHGDESPDFALMVQDICPVIKAFRIDEQFDGELLNEFGFVSYFIFDTVTPYFGGSGKKFDWNKLYHFNIRVPFLLSGGIGPGDSAKILEIQHPFFAGIDINSKFEVSPGVKDIATINKFLLSLNPIINR